jgi:NADP-dependent 3-hydroxy acid dehydrogenase YdfG
MTGPLEGRSALVTEVALVARTLDQLEGTAASIRALGGRARVIAADLADPHTPTRVASEVGPLDILVNNAAIVQPAGPTITTEPEQWARAFAINVDAPIQLALKFLPSMLKKGWGRIVNVSSGIVQWPEAIVGLSAYTATKAASKPTASTWPPNWREADSPSTSTVPVRSTRPCKPGSAASHQSRSAPASITTFRPPMNGAPS